MMVRIKFLGFFFFFSEVTSTRGPWRWTTGLWASGSVLGRWFGTSAASTGSRQTPSQHAWCPTSPTAPASWIPFTSSPRQHPSCPSLLGLGLPSLRWPPPLRPRIHLPSQADAGIWPCWEATRRPPPWAWPRRPSSHLRPWLRSTGFRPSRRRHRSAPQGPTKRPPTAPPGLLPSASCPLPLLPPLPPHLPLTRTKSLSGPSRLWGRPQLSAGESATGQPSRCRDGALKLGLSEGSALVSIPNWTQSVERAAPRSEFSRIIETFRTLSLSAFMDLKSHNRAGVEFQKIKTQS